MIAISCKKEKQAALILPEANQWILDSMKVYYYWNEQLPKQPEPNNSASLFFQGLRYSADRFSYMEDPAANTTEYSSFAYYGFEYALVQMPAFPGRIFGTVTLVVPNGPAAKKGLKRGDLFSAVNGIEINSSSSNAIKQLLKQGANISLQTLKVVNDQLISGPLFSISYSYFREQPVYLTKIFSNGNKKTGYIFYNNFNDEFDRNILDSIAKFKNKGIKDLILDLRYNPGGAVSSAAKVAAAVVSVNEGEIFLVSQANKNGGRFTDSFGQTIAKGSSLPRTFAEVINSRISIEKLFVLTSSATASSAELLINNLKPYLNVVQIGEKTIGKDMSSFEIYDQRVPKKIMYVLHPLIFKLYNSKLQGDYSAGLVPDYFADEFSTLPLKEFGDKEEILLKKALEVSLGTSPIISSKVASNKVAPILSANTKAVFQSSFARSTTMSPISFGRGKTGLDFKSNKK
ncbi:S41 family peptidase [Pedobacter polaris]|nr:S41 family peptidase [Pedobacter polaris]